MRTGAAGVLVGFGGAASTTRATLGIHAPMATAVADVAGARRDYLDESGGRYVHVIADGGVGTSGDIVKALAMGADAVMLGVALARATDAPGRASTGAPRRTTKLPARGKRGGRGSRRSEEILYGPAPSPTAPRTSSARCASRWRPPATPTSRSSSASSRLAPYES
jgi:IMP dehydrogenase